MAIMHPQGSFPVVYELHLVPEESSMILAPNLVTLIQNCHMEI
jgi:hypothetical protein